MAADHQIIVFEPHGPAGSGLAEWDPIDPAEILEGTPVQRGHVYDDDPAAGYLTGVWDCTAFIGKPGPYPDDELMILLEGTLVLHLPDGTEVTVREGDAFVIPKGLDVQWKQPGYLRKIFVILSEPVDPAACNPSLSRVTVADLSTPAPAPGAVETASDVFVNSNGHMTVSLHACSATSTPERAATHSDLYHVTEGALTLASGGATHRVGPGQTAYVPKGTPVALATAEGTRFLRSRYGA